MPDRVTTTAAVAVVLDSVAIDRLQRAALATPPRLPAARPRTLPDFIRLNHCCNRLLWEQEDQARRVGVPDREIAQNKRAIDRFNQQRNDAVEGIDEALLAAAVAPRPGAWFNSETAGSIIDRLSINLLKLHHMQLQAERETASAEHRARCAEKCLQLAVQRLDLLGCLQRLLAGLRDGSCYFRVYRQYKMYNDPALNPYLCAAQREYQSRS